MALVRKILEATIPSGGSSATFTDSDIPNSLIRVYSTNSNIYPQNISLAGTTLTVTYEAVSSALGVAVELVKQGLEIDDNLISDASDHALSAKQGKALKGLIDSIPAGVTELSDLDDVDITDIEDGQILAWDETAEKFVNVDQSGGSTQDYTETEVLIGKWIDNKNLYKKTIKVTNVSMAQLSVYDLATLTNIDTIFLDSAFAIEGSIVYMIPEFGMRIRFDISTQKMQAVTPSGSVWSNATFVVNILYTKTVE